MDCRKGEESLVVLGLMCEKCSKEEFCNSCKLSIENNGEMLVCGEYIVKHPKKAIEVLQEWADKNLPNGYREVE